MITKKSYEELLNDHSKGNYGTQLRTNDPVMFECLFFDFWLLLWSQQKFDDPVVFKCSVNDPRPIRVKFDSTCASCHSTIPKGQWCYYWPASKKAYCLHCGEADYKLYHQQPP